MNVHYLTLCWWANQTMAYRVLLLEEVNEKIIINLANFSFCDHNKKFSDHKKYIFLNLVK